MDELFQKLNDIISNYDSFIIAGHKNPDLDSVGSSLALCEIIESFDKNAYVFLNDKTFENYNPNISKAFRNMKKDIICVNDKTYKKVNGKTLLIITDVHSQNRLEYPELIDIYDVIVLDHHIKNRDYIKNSKFLYIDSNLSSMSELVAYYADYLKIKLDNVISTILLAGIEIDTNSFNLKTTENTYGAASILMRMGADSVMKQELLKESKEEYIKRASYIKNSFMLTSNVAMCIINGICTNVELAEIAEELLTFENVKASFAIGKANDDVIGVSARSLGDIDVSVIMKKMGGGGHSSNAATQIKDKSIREIKQEIKNILINI